MFTQYDAVWWQPSLGFGLIDSCDKDIGGCTINRAATAVFLMNGTQSLQVLNNVSSVATVSTYDNGLPYAYLAVPPSSSLSDIDWIAQTFALQTQCGLASVKCNLHVFAGWSTPFNCSNAFYGDVTANDQNFFQVFFTDSTLSSNDSLKAISNPFYSGTAAMVNPNGGSLVGDPNSQEIITTMHGGTAFVLICNTTVYDVKYSSVNGTITDFEALESNSSTTNFFQSGIAQTEVGITSLKQAASLATLSGSPQGLADEIALTFSKTALAIGAQAVERGPALFTQQRTSFLVSKVPVLPLYAVVVANMLFAIVGVILTVVALISSRGDTRDVQARLSVAGLVADRFEGATARLPATHMDDLFDERQGKKSMRVGVDGCDEGGYAFKTWE